MYSVGIIGGGGISNYHHRGFTETGRATVTKVYDVDVGRATEQGRKWGAEVAATVDELVSAVDIVVITTPGFVRREYVERAAQAGAHIMCEKPLALNIDEARAIERLIEQSSGIFAVALNQRYEPDLATLKGIADSGKLGDLVSAWVRWHAPAPSERWREIEASGHWRASFELSGGRITEFSSHAVDWLLWVLGEPRSVYGKALHVTEGFTLDDANYALIECESGTGMLDVCRHAGVAPARSYGVMGRRGSVILDNDQIWLTLMDQPPVPIEPDQPPNKHDHFLDCVENGTRPATDIQAGLNTVRVCTAFNHSAKTGTIVPVLS